MKVQERWQKQHPPNFLSLTTCMGKHTMLLPIHYLSLLTTYVTYGSGCIPFLLQGMFSRKGDVQAPLSRRPCTYLDKQMAGRCRASWRTRRRKCPRGIQFTSKSSKRHKKRLGKELDQLCPSCATTTPRALQLFKSTSYSQKERNSGFIGVCVPDRRVDYSCLHFNSLFLIGHIVLVLDSRT